MVARLVSARPARLAVAASTVLLLVMAQLVGFMGTAQAASTFNADDYAQCANDKPPSTALDCPGDWINGILNANNSHYAEDQVTPQRLQVTFDSGGQHSVTLSYLARKGVHHAYDSLATWNHTQTAADRCQGLLPADCVGGAATTLAIPADSTHVPAAGPTISDVTSGHQLSGQVFTMYGGTLLSATNPSHDNAASLGQDDYASITVTFNVTNADHTVQLLFGGHLATSVGPRGWGVGLGSSDINGGPYHIKWIAADAASIGNRDNQIMSSAILPPATTSMTTNASASSPTIGSNVTVQDTATITPATAQGTVTFRLYSDSGCTNLVSAATSTKSVVAGSATSDAYTVTDAGDYYWIASFDSADDTLWSDVVGKCGDANESVSIGKAQPSIATVAHTDGSLPNGTIYDVATVSGGFNPTGTVTFQVFGPEATPTCDPADEQTLTNATVALSGGTATSPTFTPTAAGNYYWVATYNGDANNKTVAGACGDDNETSSPGKVAPSITTTATSATIGNDIHDTATVSGGFNPTGTVTFQLFGPETSPTCDPADEIVLANATQSLSGGTATSPSFTPTVAGTYYWIATYNGDSNNNSVSGACGDDGETSVIRPAKPSIDTTATDHVTVGGAISDTATLSGGANPTGTITFRLYSDDTCQTEVTAASSTKPVTGTGATSDPYTPASAGTYYWIASYSGDANNDAVSGACGDDGETSVVNPAKPTIATTATGSVTIGDAISDTATLSGGANPTGTITFRLYSDDTCQTEVTAASSTKPVSGGSVSSDPYTPTTAGTYYWIASYSGDANNDAVSGACGDDGETSVVSPATPTIATSATPTAALAAPQLGGSSSVTIQDTATLTGATSAAGGTVTFELFGPTATSTPLCTGQPIATSRNPVQSGSAVSDAIAVTAPGWYWWVASYSGDASNVAVAGACGDANESTNVTQGEVGLTKTADPAPGSVVQPGQEIAYTVSVPNTGGAVVAATVVDTLPAFVVVDESSISDGGSFTPGSDLTTSAGTITWTGISVPAGGSTDLTYLVHVSDLAPEGTLLTNLAQLGLLSASTTHQVAAGELALTKAVESLAGDNVGSFVAGDDHNTLVYTLTGTATGNLVQHNVVITDVIPGYDPTNSDSGVTTYVVDSATCSVSGCTASYDAVTHQLTWQVGDVAPGDVVTVTFRVTIDKPDFDETVGIPLERIDNIAFIASAGQDRTPSNLVRTPVQAVLGVKISGGRTQPPTEVLGEKLPKVLPFTGATVPPLAASLIALTLLAVGVAMMRVRRPEES